MTHANSAVRRTDVARAVKGAIAGGMDVGEILIDAGKIIIRARRPVGPAANDDELDDELRNHEAQHGQG